MDAYRFDFPTLRLSGRQHVYMDAYSGEILWIDPVNQFKSVPARAFQKTPNPNLPLSSQTTDVTLNNLNSNAEGSELKGNFFDAVSYCFYQSDGQCADSSESGSELVRKTIAVPAPVLGVQDMTPASTIYVDAPQGIMASRAKNDGDGFFYEPIDGYIAEAEVDPFAEVQVYYTASEYFTHIQNLLGDKNFRLRPAAMGTELDPKAMEVRVNQMLVNLFSDDSLDMTNPIEKAIINGEGTEESPIFIDGFVRYSNAAYIPAVFPGESLGGSLDSYFAQIYDSKDKLIFFQGILDYAYDPSIMIHEFNHALMQSLNPYQFSYGYDAMGAHAEPGALGEGLADYLAASFLENPKIGSYTASEYDPQLKFHRDLSFPHSCPNDYIGQVHKDGEIVGHALWKIRTQLLSTSAIDTANQFDSVVLQALQITPPFATFTNFSQALLTSMQVLGSAATEIAQGLLKEAGMLNCNRILDLSVDQIASYTLFIKNPTQFGFKNFIGAPVQLRIEAPPHAQKMLLSWQQSVDQTDVLLANSLTAPKTKDTLPVAILVAQEPIRWHYSNRMAIPLVSGRPLDVDFEQAESQFVNGNQVFTLDLEPEGCENKTLYMVPISRDYNYILGNFQVAFEGGKALNSDCSTPSQSDIKKATNETDTGKKLPPSCACSLSSTPTGEWLFALIACIFWLIRRRIRQLQ